MKPIQPIRAGLCRNIQDCTGRSQGLLDQRGNAQIRAKHQTVSLSLSLAIIICNRVAHRLSKPQRPERYKSVSHKEKDRPPVAAGLGQDDLDFKNP